MAANIFSTKLSELRKEKKVTQEQLAKHLGVSAQAVSKWENGSYPDGDLLPRIADFFDVSIDYLYGRACKEVSIEQQIVDRVKKIQKESEKDTASENIRELALDCLWAVESACWEIQKKFNDRPKNPGSEALNVSQVVDNAGFNYMRLNQDFEYGVIVKEPKDGFASYFKITDELAGLFRFLSDKDHLKILFYMLSMTGPEAVRVSTLEKRLSIPASKVEKALEYLCSFCQYDLFYKGVVLDEYDNREVIYHASWNRGVSILMLLLGADAVLNQPCNYQIQMGSRNRGWFDRKELKFLK